MQICDDKLQELLTITMEECAEVTVEASKIIRFGNGSQVLENEIGDVMCMFELLAENGYIDWAEVSLRAEAKREKLKKWSDLEGL